MSQASVLALVADYAFNLEDGLAAAGFYSDLMFDAARWGISTVCLLVETTRGDADYVLPNVSTKEYAIFYDDIMLSMTALRDLEAINRNWRDAVGRPSSYIVQDQGDHHLRVYPTPNEASQDFSFMFGAPMGHDFPARSLGVVCGEQRADQPAWLDVPLALALLGREYDRESDHRDPAFAQACREVGTQLLAMVAI